MDSGISNLNLLIFSVSFLFLTGCSHSSFLLSDDSSIIELNKMVSERHVIITVKDSIYEGDNLSVRSDSISIEFFSIMHKNIPYPSMKKIDYIPGTFTEGIIELQNKQSINARNIFIANSDSIIRFDEILNTSKSFPTKELRRIHINDIVSSIGRGIGYGLGGGLVTGLILGSFIGSANSDIPVTSDPNKEYDHGGLSRMQIMAYDSIVGVLVGSIGGAIIGGIITNGDTIDIIYNYGNNIQ